jgi:hypothetical protein
MDLRPPPGWGASLEPSEQLHGFGLELGALDGHAQGDHGVDVGPWVGLVDAPAAAAVAGDGVRCVPGHQVGSGGLAENRLAVLLQPPLKLRDGDDLEPPAADPPDVRGDVLAEVVVRYAERGRGLLDAERQARDRPLGSHRTESVVLVVLFEDLERPVP